MKINGSIEKFDIWDTFQMWSNECIILDKKEKVVDFINKFSWKKSKQKIFYSIVKVGSRTEKIQYNFEFIK